MLTDANLADRCHDGGMAPDPDAFDLVVLGGGSAGETAAARVAAGGRRVAVVESRLVGGECPYWGCVPSKALLIAASRRRQAARASELGAVGSPLDVGDPSEAWRGAVRMRNERAKQLTDDEATEALTSLGVEVIRGEGRIREPGAVDVAGHLLRYEHLLISTGAEPTKPPIDGLADVEAWTSDDILTNDELPASMIVIGGGAIGVELAQVYSTFGCQVTIVEVVDRLLALEEPEVSAAAQAVLGETGVRAITGVGVTRASRSGSQAELQLADGAVVTADRLLVATGRRPRVSGLGLEALGIEPQNGALATEPSGRIAGQRNVFAAGDVTGRFPFTHTANYAGRVIAANILGGKATMRFEAVPRGVFIDPPVAGVGLSTKQALDEGRSVHRAVLDVGETARAWLEGESGVLVMVADAEKECLVGASALGPRADEWIAQVTLAIRAEVPLATLVDTIQPFPAVSEALFPAYEDLLRHVRT